MKGNITQLIGKFTAVVSFRDMKPSIVKERCEAGLKPFLNETTSIFAYILHDRDIDENGRVKTLHAHIVGNLHKRTRKSTLINRLADCLGVSTLAVSVEKQSSFEGCFQYLTHKNDPDKYQYSLSDVVTNLAEDEIDMVMDDNSGTLDVQSVMRICLTARSIVDVIEQLGMSTYCHYRQVVLDIYHEVRNHAR